MKKKLLMLSCLFIVAGAKAGDDDKSSEKKRRFLISCSIGVDASIGLGQYGSSAPLPARDSSHLHGYSELGFYFDVSVGYQITNVIGIMASLNGNFDDFNTVAFQNAYANSAANPIAEGEVTASGNYFLTQYLAGPFFEIPCSKKKLSTICIKLLGGPMHCNYPTLTSTEAYTYTQTIPNGSGFSYRIGLGYETYTSQKVRFSFNVGYSWGTLTYSSETFTQVGQGIDETYTSHSSRTMSVGLIQLSTSVIILI